MPVTVAFIGRKGAGAADVLSGVIAYLAVRGQSAGVLKHLSKPDIEIDQPGKDTYEFRMNGARKVIISGSRRYAVFENLEEEKPFESSLDAFRDFDWVFLLGYFTTHIPTIEVGKNCCGDLLGSKMSNLIAVYSATGLETDPEIKGSAVMFTTIQGLGEFLLNSRASMLKDEVTSC